MSIADKIKELQKVQAKIELYERLATNITMDLTSEEALAGESPELVEVIPEFIEELIKFAKSRVDQLNGMTPRPKPKPKSEFQPLEPEHVEAPPKKAPPPDHMDPLTFALKWKKNEGKDVEFTTKDGIIQGNVRGVNPPNIVVETKSGITITVPPNELTIKG